MNKREAQNLARWISRADGVEVTGLRSYAPGTYAIDCMDTTTGIPFVVNDLEDWRDRVRASIDACLYGPEE